MIKQLSYFKRRAGMSVDDFQQHWRTQHAEIVCKLPGLRRYVQNHVLPSNYTRREPIYDGIAEVWFDGIDDLRANAGSAALAAVLADEPNFIDAASMASMLADEVVIIDGTPPANALKLIPFISKRADITPEQFQLHWRTQHAAIVRGVKGQIRYVQNHCRLGLYRSGRKPAFDGVPMSWYASRDELRESGKSEAFARVKADEQHFLATSDIPFVICAEVVVRG